MPIKYFVFFFLFDLFLFGYERMLGYLLCLAFYSGRNVITNYSSEFGFWFFFINGVR